MKTLKTTIKVIAFLFLTSNMMAQKSRDILKEEVSFPTNNADNLLIVNNVTGFVTVEAYNGASVQIEAERIITGKKNRSLDADVIAKAEAEIGINIEQRGAKIYAFLKSPYSKMNFNTDSFSHNESNVRRDYEYTLNITIKVPANTNLKLSTINNGDISVKGVTANEIIASNINGGISLLNVSGKVDVNALNKDIDVVYAANPTQDSKFNSLNGDITIKVPQDLNAIVSFKSLNGDLYTNFDTEPIEATMKPSKRKNGTSYKKNKKQKTKFGNGGVALDFKLLNGDVTIKK